MVDPATATWYLRDSNTPRRADRHTLPLRRTGLDTGRGRLGRQRHNDGWDGGSERHLVSARQQHWGRPRPSRRSPTARRAGHPLTGAWDESNLLLTMPSSAAPPDSGPPAPTGSTVDNTNLGNTNRIVVRGSILILHPGTVVAINPSINTTTISTPVTSDSGTDNSALLTDGSTDDGSCDCSTPTADGSDTTVDTTAATDAGDPSGGDTSDTSSDNSDGSDWTDFSTN